MIFIKKNAEPPELLKLRQKALAKKLSPKLSYQTLKNPLKQQVRQNLIDEQGSLCAYCMCRIPRSDVQINIAPVVIEHIIPRNPIDGRDVGQGLDYNNLLAVCHGNRSINQNVGLASLTCDAHRANIELKKVNPCIPKTLASIYYTLDGQIHATDPDVEFDLVNTLNLNCSLSPLLSERKAALDSLVQNIGSIPSEQLLTNCILIRTTFLAETNPKTPYVGILLYYLDTLIGKLS